MGTEGIEEEWRGVRNTKKKRRAERKRAKEGVGKWRGWDMQLFRTTTIVKTLNTVAGRDGFSS